MARVLTSLMLLWTCICVQVAGFSQTVQPINPVVQWNRTLLMIVRTPGAQPTTIHPTHSFAILHAAIYDAVNSIDRTHRAYLIELPKTAQPASQEAAADAAAHEVLVALYPTFQPMLDTQFEQSLAQIPAGAAQTLGVHIGETIADGVLALRNNDGSELSPLPYVFGTAPGDYQPTPPNLPKPPQFTHWSLVTPFTLESADQFRPGPPPALTSKTYTRAFDEIKTFGIANSTVANVDQVRTGHFWNGAIQNYWNEIAQTAALQQNLTTAQSARLFALLNLTIADGVIAFYDAKYTYNFWRPVTAVRAADKDGNPETTADPNWLPEVGNTAPDPSYPGAHAVVSAAGASVLISFLHTNRFDFNVTSEVMPGVVRPFHQFSAAEEEVALSRVFAGVHFRFDETAGIQLGNEIAHHVLTHFLTPR